MDLLKMQDLHTPPEMDHAQVMANLAAAQKKAVAQYWRMRSAVRELRDFLDHRKAPASHGDLRPVESAEIGFR